MLYDAWIAEYHWVRRHIYIHEAAWCYQHIVTNGDVSHYCCIDSNPHPIADYRCAFSDATIRLPDYHSFVNIAIFPDSGTRINGDVIGVT